MNVLLKLIIINIEKGKNKKAMFVKKTKVLFLFKFKLVYPYVGRYLPIDTKSQKLRLFRDSQIYI